MTIKSGDGNDGRCDKMRELWLVFEGRVKLILHPVIVNVCPSSFQWLRYCEGSKAISRSTPRAHISNTRPIKPASVICRDCSGTSPRFVASARFSE
jgi:hypothetical protein